MKKSEVSKLLNKIKGYYNSQFFIDEFTTEAWVEQLADYEYEDCEEHLKTYLKENPDFPPKPHTFTKGLLTSEEKRRMRNADYVVQCNLCHRWMTIGDYDSHYSKCLDIEYLVNIAKSKGENITREDIENCRQDIIDKLMKKYEPTDSLHEALGIKIPRQ